MWMKVAVLTCFHTQGVKCCCFCQSHWCIKDFVDRLLQYWTEWSKAERNEGWQSTSAIELLWFWFKCLLTAPWMLKNQKISFYVYMWQVGIPTSLLLEQLKRDLACRSWTPQKWFEIEDEFAVSDCRANTNVDMLRCFKFLHYKRKAFEWGQTCVWHR